MNQVNNSNGGTGAKRTQGSSGDASHGKKQKTSSSNFAKGKAGEQKKSGFAAPERKGGKNCDLCAKYSPCSAKTHHTNQFFKWNPDGLERACRADSGKVNAREKAKRYSNAIKKSEKLKNKLKKMKRKQKRSKKHRSSGYDSSYSSYSSSSDSE